MKVERFSFAELGNGAVIMGNRGGKVTKIKEEVPPPPPAFSKEELKAAERDGYQKGFLEGEKEGRKQAESAQAAVDRKLTDMVENFATRISPLFDDYRQSALALKEQMPKVALAIARKVAGQALAGNAQAVIEDMALRALETMLKEPKLTITVHESLGDTLAGKIERLAERLQSAADIVILRDPAMPPADFRLEWSHGGMERKTEQLWGQIEKVIEDMTLTAARDTEAQLKTLETQVKKDN